MPDKKPEWEKYLDEQDDKYFSLESSFETWFSELDLDE